MNEHELTYTRRGLPYELHKKILGITTICEDGKIIGFLE